MACEIKGERLEPQDIIRLAKQYRCQGIAYTYNEPLVFVEFARDTGLLAHEEGLFNVVVSNGYGTPETVDALSQFVDCVVVGLKADASASFLRKHAGVRSPEPIFETMLALHRRTGIHVEVSNLILDKCGGSLEQTRTLCRWIRREMGADAPLHLVRSYPSYKAKTKPTSSPAHNDDGRRFRLRRSNIVGCCLEHNFQPNALRHDLMGLAFVLGHKHKYSIVC